MTREADQTCRNQGLDEVLADYLKSADLGQAPALDALLARHPEFRAEIEAFFADERKLEEWTRDLRTLRAGASTVTDEPTLPPLRDASQAAPAQAAGAPSPERCGDYELVQEIARGGMGVVYQARQLGLNRVVALKMILAGQFASADDVRRFRSEAEAAAHLNHPNIVPIYEVGECQGQQFFTMKLIEGGSLAQQAKAESTMGAAGRREGHRAKVRLVATVARAVHHAHQHGILHRDLKPGNILIDGQGEPHVTDFGLAKRVHESAEASAVGAPATLTQTGAIVGTPGYMAPEQAEASKSLTTAADTYSLGAILYEMLTGRPPFRGASPMDTILQLLTTEVIRPSLLDPHVDRDLETICLKCLEKEPGRRYASAQALADDLGRWLAGETVQARRASRWERARKWARRRPAAAGLLAVSGGSLAALLVLAAFLFQNLTLRAQAVQNLEQAEGQIQAKKTELERLQEIAEAARKSAEEERHKAEEERKKAETAQDTAQRVLYAADVQFAKAAWESNDVPRMIRYLKDHVPAKSGRELRGFEWHYLWRLAHNSRFDIRAHQPVPNPKHPKNDPFQPIMLAMAPDGKTFASGSQDREIKLWDTASGKEIRSWEVPVGIVSLGFSEDGKRLTFAANAADDKDMNVLFKIMPQAMAGKLPPTLDYLQATQKLYDIDTSSKEAARPGPFDVKKLAGPVQILWAGDAMGAMMSGFVPLEGKRVFMPLCFTASPDRSLLALGGLVTEHSNDPANPVKQQGGILLWDLKAGKEKAFLPAGGLLATLAFSPDGQTLMSSGMDQAIRSWDVATGKELPPFRSPTGFVASVVYGSKDRLVSSSFDGTVKLWDLVKRELLASFKGHQNSVTSAVLSPDGKTLVSASVDGNIKVWDAQRTPGPERFEVADAVAAATFTADGQAVLLHAKDSLTRHSLDGKEIGRHQLPIASSRTRTVFAPDGRYLAVLGDFRDRTLKMIDTEKGQLLWSHAVTDTLGTMAFSADGRRLAATGAVVQKGSEINIVDTASGKLLTTLAETDGSITSLAFSPDSQTLACAVIGKDVKRIKLWDIGQKKVRVSWDEAIRYLASLTFSPDGKLLAAHADGEIVVRDAQTGTRRYACSTHMERIVGLHFTPDGSRLVSAEFSLEAGRGSIINFWDTTTGRLAMSLEGATGAINQLRLSPDGSRLMGIFMEQGLFFQPQDTSKTEVRIWNGTPVE